MKPQLFSLRLLASSGSPQVLPLGAPDCTAANKGFGTFLCNMSYDGLLVTCSVEDPPHTHTTGTECGLEKGSEATPEETGPMDRAPAPASAWPGPVPLPLTRDGSRCLFARRPSRPRNAYEITCLIAPSGLNVIMPTGLLPWLASRALSQ